jgi:universal stress protein E
MGMGPGGTVDGIMKEFRNIIYIADPAGRTPALERAVALAENNQAMLTVLYIWETIPPEGAGPVGNLREVLRRRSRERFESDTAPYRNHTPLQAKVLFGRPFVEVIREVLEHGRDLVVKGADGEGPLDRLFGSTDMHLLRKCPCPVWLVRAGDNKPYRRILAAVDFDPADSAAEEGPLNRQILDLAASLAISEFAQLHVVHAWDAIAESILRIWASDANDDLTSYLDTERRGHEEGLQSLLDELERRIGAEAFAYANPQLHMPRGAARHVIPQLASDLEVDLIVMGTVGRTGVPGLLIGNTAETILNHIDCAVLAVKPPGFISPVQTG